MVTVVYQVTIVTNRFIRSYYELRIVINDQWLVELLLMVVCDQYWLSNQSIVN